ncbi:Tcp11-domain-containing protein [Polychaeton citri CBS 116435]|uniref:Tcp11-domain-containing protein n=1 Tax=Polychaeton citri CBS 116435 TaxID=1314669 RepID=A0A9P4PY60_9PEZI|nr:Tcp11-domain-containing protein [Polychaeton citri CBS 116435]
MPSPAATTPDSIDVDIPIPDNTMPTEQEIQYDIFNFIKELMDSDGLQIAYCYEHATKKPPITQESLAELDMNRIITNPKLRHDVNFDRELHFRPNLDGSKGRQKIKLADDFWRALEGELFVYSFILERRWRPEEAQNEAYWEQVIRANQKRLPNVFTAIRDILKTLVPDSDQQKITDRLDVDLLMQQIERGMCDYVDLANWLAKVLTAHCAPMRDDLVRKMQKSITAGANEQDLNKIVKGLRQLLNILEHMKLDVANHQIRHMRPLLVEDTVNFQQRYNAHRMEHKKIDVRAAQTWFLCEMDNCLEEPTHLEALTTALLRDLVYADGNSLSPGTFYLDTERLRALRVDLHSRIYHYICGDVLVMLAGQSVSQSALSAAMRELYSRVSAIVGPSARFGDRIEHIASEIVRILLSLENRSQPIDIQLQGHAEQRLVEDLRPGTIAFNEHAEALTARLLPKLIRGVSTRQNMSAIALQDELVPAIPVPSTNPVGLGFGAVLEPAGMNSEVVDLDADIVRRFAHVVILHWHVWKDLVYLQPLNDEIEESCSVESSTPPAMSRTSSPVMPPVSHPVYRSGHKFVPEAIVTDDQPMTLPAPASSTPAQQSRNNERRNVESRRSSMDDHSQWRQHDHSEEHQSTG